MSLSQSYPSRAIHICTAQVHRTSKSLIASTGVDSEWTHAEANTAANPATAYLNADLWYRCCLLPAGHEFLYRTPALCSNASYSQANVPVTIVLSSKVGGPVLFVGADFIFMVWKYLFDSRNWLSAGLLAFFAPRPMCLTTMGPCLTAGVPLWSC